MHSLHFCGMISSVMGPFPSDVVFTASRVVCARLRPGRGAGGAGRGRAGCGGCPAGPARLPTRAHARRSTTLQLTCYFTFYERSKSSSLVASSYDSIYITGQNLK